MVGLDHVSYGLEQAQTWTIRSGVEWSEVLKLMVKVTQALICCVLLTLWTKGKYVSRQPEVLVHIPGSLKCCCLNHSLPKVTASSQAIK